MLPLSPHSSNLLSVSLPPLRFSSVQYSLSSSTPLATSPPLPPFPYPVLPLLAVFPSLAAVSPFRRRLTLRTDRLFSSLRLLSLFFPLRDLSSPRYLPSPILFSKGLQTRVASLVPGDFLARQSVSCFSNFFPLLDPFCLTFLSRNETSKSGKRGTGHGRSPLFLFPSLFPRGSRSCTFPFPIGRTPGPRLRRLRATGAASASASA